MSRIAIWNRALGFLGTRAVASEHENTPEAIQCRLYWDSARRQALRDYPWGFAQRRAWLARMPLPEGYAPEFRFAYALPQNCLRVHELRHEGLSPRPFSLVRDAVQDVPCLVSSAARALLLYTEDVTSCRLFDDLFAHALARRLAALVAVPLLRNNSQKVSELEKLYAESLPPARQAAAAEGRRQTYSPAADSWLAAREGA